MALASVVALGATMMGAGTASSAPDGGTLYLPQDGQISVVSSSGGTPTTIPASVSTHLSAVAVSDSTIYMIANNPGTESIHSIPAVGGTMTRVATGLEQPRGLEISGGRLYTADNDKLAVMSAPMTGGELTTVASFSDVGGFAEDLTISDGTIYLPLDTGLFTAPLSGGTFQPLIADTPISAVAVHNGIVYYTTDNAIMQVPVAGGTPSPKIENLDSLSDVQVSSQNLYYLLSDRTIWSVPLAGGTPALVVGAEHGVRHSFTFHSGSYPPGQPPDPETCWGSICP